MAEAKDILQRFNPVDLANRALRWKTTGWDGYDQAAPPLSREQLVAERGSAQPAAPILPEKERQPPMPSKVFARRGEQASPMPKFSIKIDTLWIAPLMLIGATREQSYAELDENELHLKMGIGEERIPLSNIESVQPHEWSLFHGIGHRLAYDGLGYVGSTDHVVRIRLKAPQSFHVIFGVHKDLSNFYLSLDHPEEFIAALAPLLA